LSDDGSMSGAPPCRQIFARELPPPGRLETTVGFVQRVRRRVAPPGSRRERLARLFYAPLFSALPVNPFEPDDEPKTLEAELVTLTDLGIEGTRRHPICRVTVFKLDHIGDLVVGMRAFQLLREGFPGAHITLVCATWNRALAERLGLFDSILCLDFFTPMNRDWAATPETLAAIYDKVRELPLEPCDLAIDLRHDADTRPCLYRAQARYRAGFQAPGEDGQPPLDLMLPVSEGIGNGSISHSIHAELRLQVLAAAVVAAFAEPPPHPALALVTRSASLARRTAVLAIGAGDPIRAWPIERYAEVGRALHARYGTDIIILGGVAEQADAGLLAEQLSDVPVRLAIGLPLTDLPALLAGAYLCVCNGSGVSHLAAALGIPTICVLGGTTRMEVWRPAGANALSLGGRTACQPCGLRRASECPWQVACLAIIQPSHVMAACETLLAAMQSAGSEHPGAFPLP
jgi:ADP-heptose:LPS heptosyltransferase